MVKVDSQMTLRAGSYTVFTILILCCSPIQFYGTEGRAIMVEPPHRSSLWRFNYSKALVNLKDDNLNCGGYDWQWGVHGGRCGVCGDGYNGSQDHSNKGKYDTGTIVRKYTDSHFINVTFEVSSNYLGYVEFKLCPRNSTQNPLDQTCFNKYPLYIDESHGTRYYIGSRGGIYDIHIRLPGGVVCKHCVLQWKYKTGYRYNGEDTCKCLGCGSQEQYVNCADIEISPRDGWTPTHNGHHRWKPPRGHDIDHHGNIQRGTIERAVIRPTKTIKSVPSVNTVMPSANRITTANTIDNYIRTTKAINTVSKVTLNPPANGIPVTLAPSYSPFQTTGIIEPTPTFVKTTTTTSSILGQGAVLSTAVLTHRPISSDRIKQEIIKMIGQDIPKRGNKANGVKVFFTLPQMDNRGFTRPKMVAEPTRRFNFLQTDIPNTQYVSVSNILDRFYPNYITPFLFSLTKPRRRTDLRLPRHCDVTSDEFRCVARGIYKQSPGISKWCERNCRAQNCVSFMCECFCEDKRRTQNSSCHAIKEFKGVEGMDLWCRANCKVGYCPPNTCSVEDCLKPDTSSNGEA